MTRKETYRYYSQNGEDFLLWNFFGYKDKGFYVEVGAFDGVHVSNTLSFERHGWSGICVEPHPKYFELCKQSRPGAICLNVACVGDNGATSTEFYLEKLGLLSGVASGREPDIRARYEKRGLTFRGLEKIVVPAMTLNTIIERHVSTEVKIDFISIDVEGTELDVLRGLDLHRFRPRVLIVEANSEGAQNELDTYMREFGYVNARRVVENVFYVKEEEEDVHRLQAIIIDCKIEKSLHPLGERYTPKDLIRGKVIKPEGVSIVVCCHNSALMLPKTLRFVAEQKVRDGIEWEVIVVDNASTDETSEVALRSWPSKAPAPLRVVHEPQLGLVYARIKGFAEADYGIVSFIDDDNWVYPDWVEVVWEVMNNGPKIGACGGLNEPLFETEPPWWFSNFEASYAVGPQGHKAGKITWSRGYLHGAGLSVRKSAWQELVGKGFQPKLVGRRGKTLTGGEDSELCLALRLAGWELWYEPRLRLQHFLPAHRLKWSYLRRVRRESGVYLVEQDPYHCALEENHENLIVRLRETWQWQTFATLIRLSWLVVTSFPSSSEGDHKLLHKERMIGRLMGLLRKRKVYDLSIREVRQAPWRRLLRNSPFPGSN